MSKETSNLDVSTVVGARVGVIEGRLDGTGIGDGVGQELDETSSPQGIHVADPSKEKERSGHN